MTATQELEIRSQQCLVVILARVGSKGLPGKNGLILAGKPMVSWTLEHARTSRRVTDIVLSTDGPDIAAVGREYGVPVIIRPAELADDTATVDSAVRHAVLHREQETGRTYDLVVILYGNVPIRPSGLTDRVIDKLIAAGADSVQSVSPVGKMHPYWMKKLGGPQGDRLITFEENAVYRRQDLPPVFVLDGGGIAVTRKSLFTAESGQPHAFLGNDQRAITTEAGEVIDIDNEADTQ